MSKDLVVVICPPLSDYPEAPQDQSHSELFACPHCKNKMWLSDKKKGLLLFAACVKKEILLICYVCFETKVKNDPKMLDKMQQIPL